MKRYAKKIVENWLLQACNKKDSKAIREASIVLKAMGDDLDEYRMDFMTTFDDEGSVEDTVSDFDQASGSEDDQVVKDIIFEVDTILENPTEYFNAKKELEGYKQKLITLKVKDPDLLVEIANKIEVIDDALEIL